MLAILIFFCLTINLFNQLRIENSLLNREWEDYKFKYNLKFSRDEEIVRQETFLQNYQFIVDTNAKNLNFTLEMNQFGHLKTHKISKSLIQKEIPKSYQNKSLKIVGGYIPKKFDWREKGVVSPVKNQFECGCGYAFSATGAMESAFAIATGKLPYLSEQEIVSCTRNYGNRGCEGGLPEKGFFYSMNKGLSTSADYPYTADEAPCRRPKKKKSLQIEGLWGNWQRQGT
uniref:Pro-cathepsin H (Trinotate prediction) n=1 Tax=Myxobolus squamalis TaxID=59785 RepID=A0A6B2G6W8_MYXSQ